jgi:hypothetical protein
MFEREIWFDRGLFGSHAGRGIDRKLIQNRLEIRFAPVSISTSHQYVAARISFQSCSNRCSINFPDGLKSIQIRFHTQLKLEFGFPGAVVTIEPAAGG